MRKKGCFITIEGCEGSGKSTQISMLKGHFERSLVDAIFTREPGGTPLSEQIRSVILSPQNKMEAVTELLLYAAARRQHTEEVIKPALMQGKIVVCDRYADSTLAYQGYGRGLDLNLIKEINKISMGGVEIDLTLFFDLPPSSGFARKGGADKSDRMDSESLDFHERVYAGFKKIAREKRVETIDASKPAPHVFEEVLKVLTTKKILG